MGEERKLKIKLEKELADVTKKNEVEEKVEKEDFKKQTSISSEPLETGTFCTICAELISDYTPKFFLGIEINAACDECQDSSETDSENDREASDEPFT